MLRSPWRSGWGWIFSESCVWVAEDEGENIVGTERRACTMERERKRKVELRGSTVEVIPLRRRREQDILHLSTVSTYILPPILPIQTLCLSFNPCLDGDSECKHAHSVPSSISSAQTVPPQQQHSPSS